MDNVPIYIKIDDYKEIAELLSLTREKIVKARDVLAKIHDVVTQENEVIASWTAQIEDVEQWVGDVDSSLMNKQNP